MSENVSMDVSGTTRALLESAFPFHFAFDREGRIRVHGPSFERLLSDGEVASKTVLERFSIEHPSCVSCVADMFEQRDKLVLLRSREANDLMLRGQLQHLEESDLLVFLGAPWITDLGALKRHGMTLEDFPLHSPMYDFLLQIQAQKVSLEDSRKLADELSTLNAELEARVERRTRALEEKATELLESKVELENEMAERQRIELELRHAQKLEAVGQMAAGIAHEINTPIQFVGDSLRFLDGAFTDLERVAGECSAGLGEIGRHETLADLAQRLESSLEDADVEYLSERVPKALGRALEGVERVATIVGAMKEFSHPDQRETAPADINAALRTTLTVASNEYKYAARVELELGELPPVYCHVGDLNQVFLNLVVNAAHAIIERYGESADEGVIAIRSWHEDGFVHVSVADNGDGVPELVQHRLFDPFFTTKEVGKGTGQGLSISHRIVVDNHGGKLHFETEPERGTTFFVALPLGGTADGDRPSEEAAAAPGERAA